MLILQPTQQAIHNEHCRNYYTESLAVLRGDTAKWKKECSLQRSINRMRAQCGRPSEPLPEPPRLRGQPQWL